MCRRSSLFHLCAAGAGLAIGDVVFHRVVKQHGVLRHDANRLAHTGLGDLFDVLPGNQNFALLHVVKPEHQSRQSGLARARRPHHSHSFASWNLEADVVQDGTCHIVGKTHIVKLHRAGCAHIQRGSAGHIRNLALTLHQREHLFQVRQALLDFTVNHTQEIERDIELDHEGVDHHQVAQRHTAIHHTLRGAPQHRHQRSGNDELLSGVEQAQRGLALHGGTAVFLQVLVVSFGFEFFVVEVFDGFVVQQRINGAAVGRGIHLVHALSELRAPLGHRDGEGDVKRQRGNGDPGKPHIEFHGQQREHQRHLDQRGDDAVKRVADQRMHAACAAFDIARHATGLALQVKAQTHGMQMAEHLQ